MSDSPRLIDWVHRYQQTTDLAEREKLAVDIIQRMTPALRLQLLSLCKLDDVDDVLQETLLDFVCALPGFEGESDAQIWAWIRTIAKHNVIDRKRKQSINPADPHSAEPLEVLLEESAINVPMAPAEDLELADDLRRLRKLAPKCFELLWRRYVEGASIKEIAADLNEPYNAVRMRMSRCEDSLRSMGS